MNRGKCTVGQQSFTDKCKEEAVRILNGKNSLKDTRLSKNQLLFIWQSCKDAIQAKCPEERKFTGLSKEFLLNKINQYGDECRSFVQSIVIDVVYRVPPNIQPPNQDFKGVKFPPSKLLTNSKVLLKSVGGKMLKCGTGLVVPIAYDKSGYKKVSIVALGEMFKDGFEYDGEIESVELGSFVSWLENEMVDFECFNQFSDASGFIQEVDDSQVTEVLTSSTSSQPVIEVSGEERWPCPVITSDYIKHIKSECVRVGLSVMTK